SIPDHIPVILDFKRGDIGNTAAMYARSAFEHLGVDAVTVNPYLGKDSIEPFTNYREKGTFVLCLTSNPSSSDIQRQLVILDDPPEVEDMPPEAKAKKFAEFFRASTLTLFSYIAGLAIEWNGHDNVGLVVGATSHAELKQIREKIGEDMPVLIPGIGAQGGDLEKSVINGSNSRGEMAIINVARGIIYAWRNESLFQSEVRDAAESFRRRIMEAASREIGSSR
ncbi:MAG: orotidine-5'-phosphate decarboxylase, partial [candidate division Zixibacteria bacterium]